MADMDDIRIARRARRGRLPAHPAMRGSRASTTGPATTGRTPIADRRPPASPGSSRPAGPATGAAASRAAVDNPFLAERPSAPAVNPFAARPTPSIRNPFLDDDEDDVPNPFAPGRAVGRRRSDPGAPRKLELLTRGLGVIG